MIKQPFWFLVLIFGLISDLHVAKAIKMGYQPGHLDRAILGLERLYGECRERNIKLIRTESTKFPLINIGPENMRKETKSETTEILYNLYYLCRQENNELSGTKKEGF